MRKKKKPRKRQRGTDEHKTGADSGSPQWLEREIRGSTFLMYPVFRECTWPGIFRSIYFHILILMPNLWQSLVSKETGGGRYEKLGSKFFPLFQCSVSKKHQQPMGCMRIKESSAGETPWVCEVQFKSWNTGRAGPEYLPLSCPYNTRWCWFYSTCIQSGLSEAGNNLTTPSLLSHWISKSARSAAGHSISWSYNLILKPVNNRFFGTSPIRLLKQNNCPQNQYKYICLH